MSKKTLRNAIVRCDHALLATLREGEPEELSLAGQTFHDLHLVDLDLTGLDLTNTEWENCIFDRVSLDGAVLDGAYITGSTFLRCTIDSASLDGFALDGCVLRDVSLSNCLMENTELSNTQFHDSRFEKLELVDADWSSVAYNGGSIVELDGRSGQLTGVTLRGANLESVDTAALQVELCSVTDSEVVPVGFVKRQGRRQRL